LQLGGTLGAALVVFRFSNTLGKRA